MAVASPVPRKLILIAAPAMVFGGQNAAARGFGSTELSTTVLDGAMVGATMTRFMVAPAG